MKDIRLLPLVILAVGALLALKGTGLMIGGESLLGGSGPAVASDEPADAGHGAEPAEGGAGHGDPAATESHGEGGAADNGKKTPEQAQADEPSLLQRVLGSDSRSRDSILESLGERREQLDAREKELDLRENLLKAAEQRLEQRIAELKDIEGRLSSMDTQQQKQDSERLKNLVTMYENMKPKDAARIFDRLDMSVVVQVATLMSARQMSLVLAEMQSETAQRLTLELAAQPPSPMAAAETGGELPKIVGTRPAN